MRFPEVRVCVASVILLRRGADGLGGCGRPGSEEIMLDLGKMALSVFLVSQG
jgi:hypothetical protein